ncbi:metallophosphoesterase family protein [Variovorax sp. PAMC26660]|uniref:metallophosphoesterase family protein n=1 Tax=Variovorax sp. PAMC26660 TaxID=2762322 RepID=UPI00164E9714|nr:metallophosphoesterase [Variovorax sp. PAMC26660]QNK71207.1 metallophosphoesterase [Variovorax sp. PAMC26660]
MTEGADQISWLHLSDLHAGQANQDWLWPTLQTRFYEDLRRVHPRVGRIDLVIFSGDLTQSGSKEDFAVLRKILERLWQEFNYLGSNPKLFIVPGNHDLTRPQKFDANALAVKSWWTNSDVKEAFWADAENPLRKFVDGMFVNYQEFRRELAESEIPICETTDGEIPGDVSSVVHAGNFRLGLVGLNSSFLHFFDDQKNKHLDLDPRQLLSVTGWNPDEWCRENDVNFLVTHHPSDWLHDKASLHFQAEINPPGRFAAHLYGHMHDPAIRGARSGGSAERKTVQAASLFGLRKIEGTTFDRIHGYCAAKIITTANSATIKFWPRIDKVVDSAVRRFVPDDRFDLEEENFFAVNLKRSSNKENPNNLTVAAEVIAFREASEEAAREVSKRPTQSFSHQLKPAPQHLGVRRLEQKQLRRAMEGDRKAWLVSDWNSGTEEFVWSVFSALSDELPLTYRFSLQEYDGREGFFSKFSLEAGRSFQEFAKSVFGPKKVLLLLDDAPVSRSINSETSAYEVELESIIEAFRDYCPNSLVLLISRQRPTSSNIPVVELPPLEEPDVRAYVLQSDNGGAKYSATSAVSDIYRLTEGMPVEIDSLLKQLEYISLAELIEARLNSPQNDANGEMPVAIFSTAINELHLSEDPLLQRSFNLLKALAVLPYGETLARIRRFNSQQPFHPAHAATLADRGLIEVMPVVPTLKTSLLGSPQSPKLHVKKAIREQIYSTLLAPEIYELNRRAASIYFGEDWIQGQPKNIKTTDIVAALGGGGLGNPHAIINALFQQAVEPGDASKLKKIVQLARLFIVDLERGNNFRSTVTACQDFLRLIPADSEVHTADRNWFSFKLAASLRMLNDRSSATDIFATLNLEDFDKTTKRRILINWALAEEHNDARQAKELAEKIISLGKATFQAMEAQALILRLSPEDPERFNKLKAIEKKARGRKAFTAANNIAMFLSANGNLNANEKRESLRGIALSAKRNGDSYGATRAAVEIGKVTRLNSLKPSSDEVAGLIESYHYLYQERISGLFSSCHENLWHHFLGQNDMPNLLRLFRHSSFVWRLHGHEQKELPYIESLLEYFPKDQYHASQERNAESDYFLIRLEKFKPQIEVY